MSELVAGSNARKKNWCVLIFIFSPPNILISAIYINCFLSSYLLLFVLWLYCNQIQCAINELGESAASGTNKLQQEMSMMQKTTSSIRVEWTSWSGRTESQYLENTALVERGEEETRDIIHKWLAISILQICSFF